MREKTDETVSDLIRNCKMLKFKVSVLSNIDFSTLAIWEREAESLEALQKQLASEYWDHTLVIEPL